MMFFRDLSTELGTIQSTFIIIFVGSSNNVVVVESRLFYWRKHLSMHYKVILSGLNKIPKQTPVLMATTALLKERLGVQP